MSSQLIASSPVEPLAVGVNLYPGDTWFREVRVLSVTSQQPVNLSAWTFEARLGGALGVVDSSRAAEGRLSVSFDPSVTASAKRGTKLTIAGTLAGGRRTFVHGVVGAEVGSSIPVGLVQRTRVVSSDVDISVYAAPQGDRGADGEAVSRVLVERAETASTAAVQAGSTASIAAGAAATSATVAGDASALAQAAAVAADAASSRARGRFPVMAVTLSGGVDPADTVTYVSGTYTITGVDAGVIASGGLKLRGRGNSTWGRPKKPWRINFDDKTSPLGMTASQKNWALLANDFDGAKVGNPFALTVGARLSGLDWTPQYRYVELVLNGSYRGIYMLADLVRMEAGRVPGKGDGTDGAFLLEITNKERGSAPGLSTSVYGQWVIYDTPETPSTALIAQLTAKLTAFESALHAGDWSGWKALADATSFADWWLVNELTHNADSAVFWSSCKLHITPDGVIRMGPLWDFDLSLTVAWGDMTQTTDAAPAEWWTRRSAWILRMWDDAAWRELVRQRWAVLLATISELGGFDVWIDRTLDQLQRAIAEDNRRWNQVTVTSFEADKRKRWMRERTAWLAAQIAAPISPVTAQVTATV